MYSIYIMIHAARLCTLCVNTDIRLLLSQFYSINNLLFLLVAEGFINGLRRQTSLTKLAQVRHTV